MSGFVPSEEIQALREQLRRFVDDEIVPYEEQLLDLSGAGQLAACMQLARDRDLWALGHPVTMGGGGLDLVDTVHVLEVAGRASPGPVALGMHTLEDAMLLEEFASSELREQWLGRLVSEGLFTGVGMTEPEVAGSDPKMMRTTATFDGHGWTIDGHKWFTSWADRASFVTVLAKTDPTAELHRQFSAFVVPTDTPGYTLERLIPVLGTSPSSFGEIRLEGVRVGDEHLLGERGEGFRIAQTRLQRARILDGARWVGQAERAFELMCTWAGMRYAHGSALAEKGEVQRYIAESAAQIHAARLVTLDAARAIDAGHDARTHVSLVKFVTARMLNDVLDRAIQVHGAAGVSGDLPLERMFREARGARLYDGPDEVHRMVVARQMVADPSRNAPWS